MFPFDDVIMQIASLCQEKVGKHRRAGRRTHNACGGSGPRQGHHFNTLLHSEAPFSGDAAKRMFLKSVCVLNGQ